MFKPNRSFTGLNHEIPKLFSAKRAIFLIEERSEETSEAAPKDEKKPETHLNQEQINKEFSDKHFAARFDANNINTSLETLAKAIYQTDSLRKQYAKELFAALNEGILKIKNPNTNNNFQNLQDFWQWLNGKGCQIITIRDGWFVFGKNNEAIPETKNLVRATPGAPIDAPESPSPPEAAPVAPGVIRELDNEAEMAETQKAQKETKGKQVRAEVLDKATSGRVNFKNFKEYKTTKISDIYPDAVENDMVEIRRAGAITPMVAIYKNGEWQYVKKTDHAREGRVKIEYNDDLRYIPLPRKKPQSPEGIKTQGYFRVDNPYTWNEIAKTIMCTGTVPKGDIFIKTETLAASPLSDSPQTLLKEKGFDVNNPQDIKAYASILATANSNDKLYVWIVLPTANPRPHEEAIEKHKRKSKKEAIRRTGKERLIRAYEIKSISRKHTKKLLKNEDYEITPQLKEIVNNDDLWNYYWSKGQFKGKARIMKGMEMLNVPDPEKNVRGILLNAIQQGANDLIDFEDLLDAFNNKNITAFKDYEGKPASYDDFKKEYVYHVTAKIIANNIAAGRAKYAGLNKDQKEFYKYYWKKYEKKVPEHNRGQRFVELRNLLEASALIMEGLGGLGTQVDIATAKRRLEEIAKRKEIEAQFLEETGKKRFEKAPTVGTLEEAFLQSIFHPQNSRAIEETPEFKAGESEFALKSAEATAYRMIKLKASVNGKLDRKLMIRELNHYILMALLKYKAISAKKGTAMAREKENLYRRYGLSWYKLDGSEPYFIKIAMTAMSIPEELKITDSQHKEWIRNLVQDGFLADREVAEGKVEKAPEHGPWIGYAEILREARNPVTGEVIRNLLASNPEINFTEAELREAVRQVDMAFEQTGAININTGIDARTGNFALGVSKPFELPHDFTIAVGAAVDMTNGQPIIGVMVGKNFNITERWQANFSAGAGVGVAFEPLKPYIGAGIKGGVTWMSAGQPDSAWREKLEAGGRVGSSIAINLTDINFGPYLYFGYGEKKDFANQYGLLMARELQKSGYINIENKPDAKSKAEALRGLPTGVGEFMMEIQYNLKWNDEKLVQFYETQLKGTLKRIAAMQVEAGANGLSEWQIGGTIDPINVLKKLVLGAFIKLDFIVASSLKIEESLAHPRSDKEIEMDRKFIEMIESQYPGVKIEVGPEKLEDKDKLISSEFAGDQLPRIMRTEEQPAQMELNQFDAAGMETFEQVQQKFMENHLELSIDPETKMYVIRPTETQHYRVFIDPETAKNHALILKQGKILLATTYNLTNLFVKRFDYFYPAEVDGAVQHTVITISDNAHRTMGDIAEYSDDVLESRYDRRNDRLAFPTLESNILAKGKVHMQGNLRTWESLTDQELSKLYNSTFIHREILQTREEQEKLTEHIRLTDAALSAETITELAEGIDLSNLTMQPQAFIEKYRQPYRQLTTNTNPKNLEKLDRLIKQENSQITVDQLIRYKEELFRLSMAETHAKNPEETIEQRLRWAEKAVFVPFFQRRLAQLQPPAPAHITADKLAKVYISAIRQHLKDQPKDLLPGQSIFTAVGTYGIEGIRKVGSQTGQTQKQNKFVEAFDYAPFLTTKDEAEDITEEQRIIAILMLGEHSELPTENIAFLRSRLARKIFFMGKPGEVPNPLIDILDQATFEDLTEAYQLLKQGKTSKIEAYDDAIAAFEIVAEQIRDAQLGNGTPVRIDGLEARAILIGDYYYVIRTTLRSGIYDYCKNPSTVYNEEIFAYKPAKIQRFLGLKGTVSSGAADVTTIQNYKLKTTTVGFSGVGVGEINLKSTPTPGEKPTTETSEGGRGGKSEVAGGRQQGGTEEVKVPETNIGLGNGKGGTPTNPDEVP